MLIYGLFVAVLTEALQLITPGRAGATDDVLLDFFGYVVGAVVTLIGYLITYFIKRKNRRKI